MDNIILDTVVHPDPHVNAKLPRYDQGMLGKGYQRKSCCVTEHIIICEHPSGRKEDIPIVKECAEEQSVQTELVQTKSDVVDLLDVQGELSVSYGLISGSGKGVFEREDSRKRKRLTVMQTGYKVAKVMYLDSNKLQRKTDYESGAYLHTQLNKSMDTMQEYLDKQGWHYVYKVFLGCRATRCINYDMESALERKKIEAELQGKIGFGPLSISFKAKFGKKSHEKSSTLKTRTELQSIGGKPSLLNMVTAIEDIKACLEQGSDTTWNAYLESAKESNAIVRVEVKPVSSAIIPLLGLSDAEKAKYEEYVKAALGRRMELGKQRLALQTKLEQMTRAVKAVLQKGAAQKQLERYTEAVNAFIEHHIEPVMHELYEYLLRTPMEIIKGTPCKQGGCNRPTHVNLDNDEFLKKPGSLDKTQMNQFFEKLSGASREVLKAGGQNWQVLWDGPWVFGQPLGIPNELVFFHNDQDVGKMSEHDRNSKFKFKVPGEEWDIVKWTLAAADEESFVIANDQDETMGQCIDFKKLPDFFSAVAYSGKMKYRGGHSYEGDWKMGQWHGDGQVMFGSGHSVKQVQAVWNGGAITKGALITYNGVHGDDRSEYFGQARFDRASWAIMPDGKGDMSFIDSSKLEGMEWKEGKPVVNKTEDALKVTQTWFGQDVEKRVHLPVKKILEDAIERLKHGTFPSGKTQAVLSHMKEAHELADSFNPPHRQLHDLHQELQRILKAQGASVKLGNATCAQNDEGAPVKLGNAKYAHIPGGDGTGKFYCGRFLGEHAIPGTDGRCGPSGGQQCKSCLRYQVGLRSL